MSEFMKGFYNMGKFSISEFIKWFFYNNIWGGLIYGKGFYIPRWKIYTTRYLRINVIYPHFGYYSHFIPLWIKGALLLPHAGGINTEPI